MATQLAEKKATRVKRTGVVFSHLRRIAAQLAEKKATRVKRTGLFVSSSQANGHTISGEDTAVPRGLFSWSKAGLFWALVRANTPESRSAVQVAPLEIYG